MQAREFRIEVPDARLEALRDRLRQTIWADDFANANWRYGVEGGWLRDMAHYWAEEYDWRAAERQINRWPQYRVAIDGIPIHFLHVRGQGEKRIPLILTHGWPWTFWDWKDVIAPLTQPQDDGPAFDLIIPSLPGYGFSAPLATPGVDVRRIASLWVRLMRDVLGYRRFAAAGGDWGGLVTAELGQAHAEHVMAVHLSIPMLPGVDPFALNRDDYAADEQWMPAQAEAARPATVSHMAAHSSDPQTLAWALADSPIGMAAWIWERRRAWSDCNGDVTGLFGRDFLCTTASIYWFTGTIGTSMRLYKEQFSAPWSADGAARIDIPTAFLISPREIIMLPRKIAQERTNLQRWTVLERGGHFAPVENASALISEYKAFFGAFARPAGA